MEVDRDFEYIVWRPAFVSGELHVNLGAASLEKHCLFEGCLKAKLDFPLTCVFEGPNAELRQWSLIQERRTLKYDRGHSKCFVFIRNIGFPMVFGSVFTADSEHVGFLIVFCTFSVEMLIFRWFLKRKWFASSENIGFPTVVCSCLRKC